MTDDPFAQPRSQPWLRAEPRVEDTDEHGVPWWSRPNVPAQGGTAAEVLDDAAPTPPPNGWHPPVQQRPTLPVVGPVIGPEPSTAPSALRTVPAAGPDTARQRSGWLVVVALVAALIGSGIGGAVGVIAARKPATVTAATLPPLSGSTARPAGSIPDIAGRVQPSVVTINVRLGTGGDTGSGVIIRSDGFILTNNHVVSAGADGAGAISVDFASGHSDVPATIVGRDPATDLAVIKVEATDLPAASLGQPKDLRVGDTVVAVGAPLGLEGSVTSGIVSALGRNIAVSAQAGNPSNVIADAIQTDAAINPGNSGGALANDRAQVIGIPSVIAQVPNSTGGGSQGGSIGIGYAIPIDEAISIANQLIEKGKASHPYIGVQVEDISADEAAASGGTPGARITELVQGGPAQQAGLKPADVIVKVGDTAVTGVIDLVAATRQHAVGDQVSVTYVRDGASHTATVRLADNPG